MKLSWLIFLLAFTAFITWYTTRRSIKRCPVCGHTAAMAAFKHEATAYPFQGAPQVRRQQQ
uniref:Uncharacterized protein n=1 Tax=viral metagenome TaxID=1070528 RepID=A0A6C0AU84_9ZZZZ